MVIFDFDLTLVDTSPVEHLRKQGQWRQVMAAAPQLKVYDGVHQLIAGLHRAGRPMAILTKSPDMVPRAFVARHGWPIQTIVGYHQVRFRKPHPEGILLAMKGSSVDPSDVVHVGDAADDTRAAKAAGVVAVGAAWGLEDSSELEASDPDYLFHSVDELVTLLKSR